MIERTKIAYLYHTLFHKKLFPMAAVGLSLSKSPSLFPFFRLKGTGFSIVPLQGHYCGKSVPP